MKAWAPPAHRRRRNSASDYVTSQESFSQAVNVYLARPVLDSFLFSLALAVGLTPQLLPAIISLNLAHGAKRMAQKKVIVKRLASIENFGSMNVICSDKTGTLTQDKVVLERHVGRSPDRLGA